MQFFRWTCTTNILSYASIMWILLHQTMNFHIKKVHSFCFSELWPHGHNHCLKTIVEVVQRCVRIWIKWHRLYLLLLKIICMKCKVFCKIQVFYKFPRFHTFCHLNVWLPIWLHHTISLMCHHSRDKKWMFYCKFLSLFRIDPFYHLHLH